MKTVFFESLRYKLITKKMIFITAIVLIFILRLRFPKGKSVAAINTKRVISNGWLFAFLSIIKEWFPHQDFEENGNINVS